MAKEKDETPNGPEGFEATYSTCGSKKFNATQALLEIKRIHIVEGFNPRDSVGDISNLLSSIKKDGLIQPLLVRPMGKSKTDVRLISGCRRLAAIKKLGKDFSTEIPVVIRFDLEEDDAALAVALAENSEEGRSNLSPMEQGRAFQRLRKKEWSVSQIAISASASPATVTRHLKLLEAPREVLERMESTSNPISVQAAIELASADRATIKRILPQIEGRHTTALEVRKMAKTIAREDGVVGPRPGATNKKKGAARDAALVDWRQKREVSEMLAQMCHEYQNTEAKDRDSFGFTALSGGIAALLWSRSNIGSPLAPASDPKHSDDPDAETKRLKEFTRFVAAEAKKVRVEHSRSTSEESDDEEGEVEAEV